MSDTWGWFDDRWGVRIAWIVLSIIVSSGMAWAEDAPPGWPVDVPYLPTEHGLSGADVAWPSREMCEVITLSYDERVPRLRARMRRAMVDAGWKIGRERRTAFEGRRAGRIVMAIFVARGRRTDLQLYDCR